MFFNGAILRRILPVCQCRSYRTINPGVSRRLKIFKQETPDLSKMKIGEKEIEDLEVDIDNNSHLLTKDYEKEFDKIKKRINLKRVERAYFDKQVNPNFLLWAEKEQIRQLHSSEPDTWTYERLSESFPATPDIIKKIVRAQWKMKNSESIKKHDSRVLANWKLFQQEKLVLLPHLSAHLSKFTGRDRSILPKETKELVIAEEEQNIKALPPRKSEFADIVRNYVKSKDQMTNEVASTVETNSAPLKPNETYVLNVNGQQNKRSRQLTLAEMKRFGKIPSRDEPMESGNTDEELTKENRYTGIINPSSDFTIPQRTQTCSPNDVPTDDPPRQIEMKITIPKEKWKKGAVYRVNDCFYADDGEFLYRI